MHDTCIPAVLVEGESEYAVMDILLTHHLLPFSKEELLDGCILKCRSAKNFERDYLNMAFDKPVIIYRILDSRKENFKLSRAYKNKVKVVNVVTAPEIEILVILHRGLYHKYANTGKKLSPSQYCKTVLHLKDVKSRSFIQNEFHNPDHLVAAIREYHQVKQLKPGEICLWDLIQSQ